MRSLLAGAVVIAAVAATALGAHRDLNAIVDASGDGGLAERLDVLAAETVKRVVRIPAGSDAVDDSLRRLEALLQRPLGPDKRAEVMSHQVDLFILQGVDQAKDISCQLLDPIALDPLGLVTQVIAALVRCDDPAACRGERRAIRSVRMPLAVVSSTTTSSGAGWSRLGAGLIKTLSDQAAGK